MRETSAPIGHGWFRTPWPQGIIEHVVDVLAQRKRARAGRRTAHDVSVTEIMSRQVVCAHPDLDVPTLVDTMVRDRLGCVPIVDGDGAPLGMVTKLDIVEQLGSIVGCAMTAADLMMPLAITLSANATVADAAALMSLEDMHHVMIVSARRLVGLVSTADVTRWVMDNDCPRHS